MMAEASHCTFALLTEDDLPDLCKQLSEKKCSLRNGFDLHVYGFAQQSILLPRPRSCCLEQGFNFYGSIYFLVVQFGYDSEWPFCFTCCSAVFVVSPLCFEKAQSFCELFSALFVPRIYSLSTLRAISEPALHVFVNLFVQSESCVTRRP